MKLITELDDAIEAQIVSNSLREKGLMTVVTSADSQQLGRAKTGAINVGLWVMFEEQYEDAIQLLNDPDHKPRLIMSIQEMEDIEKEANMKHQNQINKTLEKAAVYILGAGLIVLTLYVVVGILNE